MEYTDSSERILFEKDGGYRFCEFNSSGDIYAIRNSIEEGNNENIGYTADIFCKVTF